MKLRKKIAVALLAGLLIAGGAVIYSDITALVATKNMQIEELQDNVNNKQQELDSKQIELDSKQIELDSKQVELDNVNNKMRQLEEDKEAIWQELNNKSKKLEQFEAILSSSVIKITLEELDLFFRLVEAEAGNESMRGKIAVANVVINRVRDSRYPDTVKGVIYQPHQFEPLINGHINKTAPADSKEAVLRALRGEQVVPADTISFWATYLDSSHELWSLPITARIGVHVFTNKY